MKVCLSSIMISVLLVYFIVVHRLISLYSESSKVEIETWFVNLSQEGVEKKAMKNSIETVYLVQINS